MLIIVLSLLALGIFLALANMPTYQSILDGAM